MLTLRYQSESKPRQAIISYLSETLLALKGCKSKLVDFQEIFAGKQDKSAT